MFLNRVSRNIIGHCLQASRCRQLRLLTKMSSYSVMERGSLFSPDYKLYFKGPNGIISPFHDIPLFADMEKSVFNMVVEIPRWTNAKMEISRDDRLNPIKQDMKKGKMRFVDNCFPHHGYIWNYGALPQTWEDPKHKDSNTGQQGDNDPIDVCEIGSRVCHRGEVIQVKVLGVLALIDEGETDWKILAINVDDPLAGCLNDIEDIDKHLPGLLEMSRNWLKVYKIPTGKPPNQFAFNGDVKDKNFALGIIKQTNEQWQRLINGEASYATIKCDNTSLAGSRFQLKPEVADVLVNSNPCRGRPVSIPVEVDTWHYIKT